MTSPIIFSKRGLAWGMAQQKRTGEQDDGQRTNGSARRLAFKESILRHKLERVPFPGLFPRPLAWGSLQCLRVYRKFSGLKNPAAVALGRLAKGKPKTLSEAERQRRRELLAKVRKLRWVRKPTE